MRIDHLLLSCYVLDSGIPLPTVNVDFNFCLLHAVQAGSEARLTSHAVEFGDSILEVKRPKLEADNRPIELRVESLMTLSLPFFTLTQ